MIGKGFVSVLWGGVLYAVISTTSAAMSFAVSRLGMPFEVVLATLLLSSGSLFDELERLLFLIKKKDIERARLHLSMLVTRDTESMGWREILSSSIETLSENFVDAVIAPSFYLALGGVPALAFYKATSTMDSMLGYKTGHLEKIGKIPALADDILNYIPARLSKFFIFLASTAMGYPSSNFFKKVKAEAGKTESPNSWIPEASVAVALGIKIGGPCSYFGKTHQKPFMGRERRTLKSSVLLEALTLLYISTAIFYGSLILLV